MLWDFSVRTDHEIEARKPDLLIIDKSKKNFQIPWKSRKMKG